MWHDQIIAKRYMDINNKNELQTYQGMDSRHMHKVNCSDKKYWKNTLLSINIVIDDRLTCDVNKVYMYMSLIVSIYCFLITMSLLI